MNVEILHDALNLLPGDLITATDKLRSRPRKAKIHWTRWASMAACFAIVLCGAWIFKETIWPGFDGAKSTESAAEQVEMAAPAAVEGAQNSKADVAEDAIPEAEEAPRENAGGTGEGGADYSDLDTITLTPTGEASSTQRGEETAPAEETVSVIALDAVRYAYTPVSSMSAVNLSAKAQTVLIRSREELEAYCQEKEAVFELHDFYEACEDSYEESWFAEHDLLLLRLGAEDSETRYGVTGFEMLEDYEPSTWEVTLTKTKTETDRSPDDNAYWHILMETDKGLIGEDNVITVWTEESQ